jgi:hypothetical protein
MECRLAGETEVLGENRPQRHFCPSQNPTWPDPGLNPGRRGEKPANNRLSYGGNFVNVLRSETSLKKFAYIQWTSKEIQGQIISNAVSTINLFIEEWNVHSGRTK